MAAFITSNGDSAKLQIAWVAESDMYISLKYVRKGNLEASFLSLSSHQEITFDLHRFFNVSFVPGAWRMLSVQECHIAKRVPIPAETNFSLFWLRGEY